MYRLIMLLGLLFLVNAQTASAVIVIEDVFNQIGPFELVEAEFAIPGSGTTTNLYSNFVRLEVSGIGQAENALFNDAFYFVGGQSTECCTGNRGMNISFTGDARELEADGVDIVAYIEFIQDIGFAPQQRPAYNDNHFYDFVIDIGNSQTDFTVGTGDGGLFDNTGQFDVRVSQLELKNGSEVIPEPSTFLLFVAGLLGITVKRRFFEIAQL